MSTEPTADSSSTQTDEQTIGGRTNTVALLEACILIADHDALQEHLENNQTEQSMLDRCLMLGLQIVQRKEQEMGRVAPALQLLWQFGAKWNSDSLLEHRMTPYHFICLSAGDHHDLLGLLIQSSGRTLLHVKDDYENTALMYAVENANIKCLRTLIAHGAEVNIDNIKEQPICLAIRELQDDSTQSPIIMTEIFDLLLDNGAEINESFLYAISLGRVECMKKFIVKGANLDIDAGYVWRMSAKHGRVDLLKCLIDRGIDKDGIDQYGRSLLWWVVQSGELDAIRYLLDLGVKLPTDIVVTEACYEQCKHCGMDMLMIADAKQQREDLCLEVICMDKIDAVQLFEENGSKSFKYFNAFRLAVTYDSVTVLEYLHRKYRHPLNTYYTISNLRFDYKHWTFLKEACYYGSINVVVYLLEHGADLNNGCSSALSIAIRSRQIELIALLICNGVDVNFRSYDSSYGDVLPFEAAVLHLQTLPDILIDAVEMLLVSGCSCGVFSLDEDHKFKDNVMINTKNLMMKWNVQENNVNPLQQQCRRMILKHLSPRASKMIEKLPLPQCLIKYLSIPELDDIVDRYKKMHSLYKIKSKAISRLRSFY